MNISSSFTEGTPQTDGRTFVVEQHVLEDGRVFKYEYLKDESTNAVYVLEARKAFITQELNDREAAKQFVLGNTSVPLTKHEFLSRFTTAERIGIRDAAKSNPIVADFMEMLNASGGVYHPLAMQGIMYLNSLGLITAPRAAIIGEAW